nr:RNA-directed DNA polymerase, eukaryota, reverse transcriptase zinc-binding domain protein [Tanacetum cinerariifolium]
GDTYTSNGVKGAANSYEHVVKGSQNSKMDSDSSPVMIQLASFDFNTDGRVTWVEIEGKVFWVRAKEVPGWIPNFVEDNDEEEDSEVGSYEEVPNGEDVKNVEDLEGDSDGEIVHDTKFEEDFPNQNGEEVSVRQGSKETTGEKQFDSKKNSKNNVEESICSGHFKKFEVPKSGGSILQLIDDLVKVGEKMGYDMKGCMKNMKEIIELQGANDGHR